jgi:periplasmic divalent cation tolerance protein
MIPAGQFSLVLVTTPDIETARRLATLALDAGLIACANIIPTIESHYRWEGGIEKSAETLMLLKTTKSAMDALEKLIAAHHPYTTPEIISLPIISGSPSYLDWLAASTTSSPLSHP